MPISAAEQYFLEVLNRARLDPAAEAARQGVGLNAGLPNGQFGRISATPLEVLAPLSTLDRAATGHSQWMADNNRFSHTGAGGSNERDRIIDAGYRLDGSGYRTGENLNMTIGYGSNSESVMNTHFKSLWGSALHRSNMMGGEDTIYGGNFRYREIGLSEIADGRNDYLTVNFAFGSSKAYITGVAYADRNGNDFYNMGEAQSGYRFAVSGVADRSETAGGYAVEIEMGGWKTVAISGNGVSGRVQVHTGQGNVKLDLVNGNELFVAAHTDLGDGINRAMLLGRANYKLIGNDANNVLTGNKGANRIEGEGGRDRLYGGAGNDRLYGETGSDRLYGGAGNDKLYGDSAGDRLYGGNGRDMLNGGTGNDVLVGGKGADTFVFGKGFGRDTIADLRGGQGDKLLLNDALWSGTLTEAQVVSRYAVIRNGDVVFDFGADEITLDGISSLRGLTNLFDII